MRFSSVLLITLSTASAYASATAKVKCSAKADKSTCSKDSYCFEAKPHSYCAKKLDGGKECQADAACKSNICFVAKKIPGSKKLGKRTCAAVPTINFKLGARCTLSEQCKKGLYCHDGFCESTVAAGGACDKDTACAEAAKGAKCLTKSASFVVVDAKTGDQTTKKLSAAHCSYVTSLGEGMKCESQSNCYSALYCIKNDGDSYKKCTKIVVAPTDLPFQHSCSADSECSSGHCVSESCGCKSDGQDCNSDSYCDASATCQTKLPYGDTCTQETSSACQSGTCVTQSSGRRALQSSSLVCGCRTSDCDSSAQYCDLNGSNLCADKKPLTAPCSSGDTCQSGRCAITYDHNNQPTSSNPVCACSTSSDCSDGEVCDGSTGSCIRSGFCSQNGPADQCSSGVCLTEDVTPCNSQYPDRPCHCQCTTTSQCGADSTCVGNYQTGGSFADDAFFCYASIF